MKFGLIGAGNMAGALSRGWGRPVLVADPYEGRAQALVAELGGQAFASNGELAAAADVLILCHKPAQLDAVAAEIRDSAKVVVSILGGTPLAAIESAYPGIPVYRVMPNVAAETARGVFCWAPGRLAANGPEAEIRAEFEQLGTVVELPEPLIEPATALMGCGPAFFALMVEALVDAGVRHGLEAATAARLTVETMAGTGALLAADPLDTAGLMRRVTSPGGSTARGLNALEHGGLRPACQDAVDAVVGAAR